MKGLLFICTSFLSRDPWHYLYYLCIIPKSSCYFESCNLKHVLSFKSQNPLEVIFWSVFIAKKTQASSQVQKETIPSIKSWSAKAPAAQNASRQYNLEWSLVGYLQAAAICTHLVICPKLIWYNVWWEEQQTKLNSSMQYKSI